MSYNLKISLDLSHSRKKIFDRISEVKSAAPYLRYSDNPEIDLFRIILNEKEDLIKFLKITENSLENIRYMPFKTRGWRKQKNDENYQISFPVETSKTIRGLVPKIMQDMAQYGVPGEIIYCNPEHNFDIFVAESDNFGDIEFLWEVIEEKGSLISQILLRIFHRKSNRPLHIPRKFCYSFEALNIIIYRDGVKFLEYSLPGSEWIRLDDQLAWRNIYEKYRILKNYQISEKRYLAEGETSRKIFVSSDLHLDHQNIIEMTARPFRRDDIKIMNEILISNWNNIVSDNDTVIFLGDLTYNLDPSDSQQYFEQLNGNIIFIRGNHDSVEYESFTEYELTYKKHKLFFVHNPKNAPLNYEGWIIHGHTHNSRMCDYPFINFINKTINISCELTEYCPVELDEIISIIDNYDNTGYNKIYSLEKIHNKKIKKMNIS